MKPFEIMSLSELRNRGKNEEPQIGWIERLLRRFAPGLWQEKSALKLEAARLRADLLKAIQACEDAGRVGLALYAENELLREKAETGVEERLVRMADLDRLSWENAELKQKLKSLSVAHERLCDSHQEWMNKFWSRDNA